MLSGDWLLYQLNPDEQQSERSYKSRRRLRPPSEAHRKTRQTPHFADQRSEVIHLAIMALHKFSLLFAVFAIGAVNVAIGQETGWPAGISPLDALSFWDDEESLVPSDATGCCLPKTWTSRLFTEIQRGRPRGEEEDEAEEDEDKPRPKPKPKDRTLRFVEVVYVDENNQRIAEDVTIPRRKNSTTISYIVLFGKNSTATVYAFSKAQKKCVKRTLKNAQFRPMCLPQNSTLLASFSLGASLKTQSWGFLVRDRRATIAGNIILTPGNCVPIIAGEKAFIRPRMTYDDDNDDDDKKKKRPTVVSVGALYTDFAAQIPDPSVFTPPSYCNKTDDSLIFSPDIDFTTIVQRFITAP